MHDVNQIILAGVVEEYRKEIVFIMSPLNQLASRFTNSGRSHRSSLMSNTPEVSLSILTHQKVGWLAEMIVSYVDRNNNVRNPVSWSFAATPTRVKSTPRESGGSIVF
jgi:hypothetical protein